MIIRVLRPVTVKRGSSPGGEEPEATDKPLADEAADANAIEVCVCVKYVSLVTILFLDYLKWMGEGQGRGI